MFFTSHHPLYIPFIHACNQLVHDLAAGQLLYGIGANAAAVRCIGTTQNRLIAAGDDGNTIVYKF